MIVKEKQFSTATDPRVHAGEEAAVVTNCDHLAKLEIKTKASFAPSVYEMRSCRPAMAPLPEQGMLKVPVFIGLQPWLY